ncbi:MAG TPA: phosphonate ABC transporter ATP-binding protein [Colwellia sp.]|jgi:putative ABC transport system ATP-binding protein|nr:phosphonate ABC transporter ATP-binding protein [Colwellia sp.]|tara:strand:- start:40 stop:813 length:774 start_codon:yes stop_codon:yes gene_type:complete
MIKFNQISRSFIGDEVETVAIDEMNLAINEGEFLSILGPSGCGKSTLLNVLGMLDSIDTGEFSFLEKPVDKYSEQQRARLRKQHIGFIFQNFNLIDELTVEQNIELPLYYHNVAKAERKRLVDAVLKRVDISHRRKHLPAKLSGGQQQRVAIARAIVTNPDLILADEPTGNLDSKNSTQVMALLRQLNQEGATIVMVTHAPEHIIYGTRVIELLDGKVVNDQLVKEKANGNTSHIINDVGSTEIAKTKQMSAEVTCG